MEERRFIISVGRSCRALKWEQKELTWSEFVDCCKETKCTDETAQQYAAMSKIERSKIKDVGGFVGGKFKKYENEPGKSMRREDNILSRSMITLDLDHVDISTRDLWAIIDRKFNCASLVYSTHSHTPEKPRMRLIIPTSRDMEREEYEPIARRVAWEIGIDMFDDSTYELPRLFYWPSTSSDAEFYFNRKDGDFLNPDEILSTYKDYRDCSDWPVSSRKDKLVQHEIKHAGDPCDKPGLIGAFCRTYTIHDAIDKFLSDIYEPTKPLNRYTYKEGSMAGGLVIYGDKFAYSHHDTDPASRKLCNAFDLVRIHKFGDLDRPSRATDITNLPSYKAMQAFAEQDTEVRKLMLQERREEMSSDFNGVEVSDDEIKWQDMLTKRKDGKYESTCENAVTILENDPLIKGKLWHNEFTNRGAVSGKLPWPQIPHLADQWGDMDDANLRVYLSKHYGIVGRQMIKDSRLHVMSKNTRHPILDYLNELTWDGVSRLEMAVISVLGAEDNELNRAMTRKHFVAAVKRIMEPGCKYDQCFVLTGPEGTGKSTFFEVMGGEWFNDSITTTEGKEGMEALQCSWIIEWSELTSIKRSAVESIKAYLSKREDMYRKAYGENSNKLPRQCVFCATTNEMLFLKGDTGNRRFWVIEINPELSIFKTTPERREYFETHRDQLWAEAVYYYRAGEKLYLNREESAKLRAVHEEFSEESVDTTLGELKKYLNMPIPEGWDVMSLHAKRRYTQGDDMCDEDLKERAHIRRERFCCSEYVLVSEGLNKNDKAYYGRCRKVAKLMRGLPDWKEKGKFDFPTFGEQRCWVFVGNNDDEDL